MACFLNVLQFTTIVSVFYMSHKSAIVTLLSDNSLISIKSSSHTKDNYYYPLKTNSNSNEHNKRDNFNDLEQNPIQNL